MLASGAGIVAVNAAVRLAPAADIHFAGDGKFYGTAHAAALADFRGLLVTCSHQRIEPPAKRLLWRRPGAAGGRKLPALSEDRSRLHGACSGGLALNLVYLLAADPIFLGGYDFRPGPGGETHWHEGYSWPCRARDEGLWRSSFMPAIAAMAPALAAAGRRVYNLNPASLLRAFPFATLPEALEAARRGAHAEALVL